MKSTSYQAPIIISYFFVLLFIYAGASKMLDFENFQVQIGQSPLLSAWAGFISYAVIAAEFLVSGLLLYSRRRLAGLYASFTLMVAFTVYIYLILNFSDFVPCSCGGILEEMGWTEHLIFNIVCVALAAGGIVISERSRAATMRRTLFIMGALFIAVSGGIVLLFLTSEQYMKKENNFIRRYPPHPILEDRSYDLKVDSYYFAGSDGNNVYLGNATSPFRILKIDSKFDKADTLQLEPSTPHTFRNLRYRIQNNMLYAYDGSVPVIYSASLDSLDRPLPEISVKQAYFDQLVPLSTQLFLLRVEDTQSGRTALATLSDSKGGQVQLNNSVLTEKADGGFDADGQLLFDAHNEEAYYMFYYRNQILKINKTMEVVSKMKTIAPIPASQINVKILKDGRKKMTAPPVRVNRFMAVYKGLLFSASDLMGKHESKDLWKKNTVVDVYSTAPAGYWGSIYVQNRGEDKPTEIMINGQYFYVLAGDEIVRYRCAQTLTESFIDGGSRKPNSE